jgi:hypothetical protein
MTTFKETLKNQQLYLEDDKMTRLLKIKNQKKADEIAKSQWSESQRELYPNSLILSTGPSLQEVLITQEANDMNDVTNLDTAKSYLQSISDDSTAQYITEKLTSLEIQSLIQQFEKIKKLLRKDYPRGISKDEFVQLLKLKQTEYLDYSKTKNINSITEEDRFKPKPEPEPEADPVLPTVTRTKTIATPIRTTSPMKFRKATAEPATSGDILDYFHPSSTKEEKVKKVVIDDTPEEIPINRDAEIYSRNEMAKYAKFTKTELLKLIDELKLPVNITGNKQKIFRNLAEYYYNDYDMKHSKAVGGKLKKKKKNIRFCGRGLKRVVDEFALPNNRLKIEGDTLRNNNILKLKYKSNNNSHPNIHFQRISQNLSDILYDIIKGKYDERFYKLLDPMEKELVKKFIKVCKFSIDVDKNETEEFNRNYEILHGEYMSGNDSNEIKAKLKQYTIFGMKTGRLTKAEAMATLVQL